MKKSFVIFLLFVCLTLSGCLGGDIDLGGSKLQGSGVEKTEKREIGGSFTAIQISSSAKAIIKCQDKQSIEVSGDDNVVPLIVTEIKDNTLIIKPSQSYKSNKPLQITIGVPNVEKLSVSSGAQAEVSNIKNEKIEVDISSGGNVSAQGDTQQFEASVSSGANLKAKDLHASKTKVDVSSGANADVYATEQLDASVSSGGNVDYFGSPKTVNKNVSSGGSLNPR